MSGSGHLRSESGKESLYLSGGEYGLGQGYDAAFLKVWPRSEKTALQLSEMGTKMKRAADEETQVEWEGPRGARPALVGGALRLHASPGPPPPTPAPSCNTPTYAASPRGQAFTARGWRRAGGRCHPITGGRHSGYRPRGPTDQ